MLTRLVPKVTGKVFGNAAERQAHSLDPAYATDLLDCTVVTF
jgi:hypothetical protein